MNIAKIRPLFKEGDKFYIRNCRPISVLLVFVSYFFNIGKDYVSHFVTLSKKSSLF